MYNMNRNFTSLQKYVIYYQYTHIMNFMQTLILKNNLEYYSKLQLL